jgi:hypothetical protein
MKKARRTSSTDPKDLLDPRREDGGGARLHEERICAGDERGLDVLAREERREHDHRRASSVVAARITS